MSIFIKFQFFSSYEIPAGKFVVFLTVVFPECGGTLAVNVGELREGGHVPINVEAKCFSASLERNKLHSCIEQGGEEERAHMRHSTYVHIRIGNLSNVLGIQTELYIQTAS